MLMLRYTIHVDTPYISRLTALVHFLLYFHNGNLSLHSGACPMDGSLEKVWSGCKNVRYLLEKQGLHSKR